MLRLAALFCVLAGAAWGQDGKATILMTDPASGRTIGKVGGETVVLQNHGTGTVGKIGKDKVLVHKDAQGNTLGQVGDRRLFCHTDPASGVSICK